MLLPMRVTAVHKKGSSVDVIALADKREMRDVPVSSLRKLPDKSIAATTGLTAIPPRNLAVHTPAVGSYVLASQQPLSQPEKEMILLPVSNATSGSKSSDDLRREFDEDMHKSVMTAVGSIPKVQQCVYWMYV